MDNHNSYYPDIGTQGESFVAQWLQQQSWQILAQRWRCRWGELDLIAYSPSGEIPANPSNTVPSVGLIQGLKEPTLAFIEVKTRSKGNWDADGRLAITAQKQVKLHRAAQVYLAEHPRWTQVSCRFDVALVGCKPISPQSQDPVIYQFHLQDYLMNAWD